MEPSRCCWTQTSHRAAESFTCCDVPGNILQKNVTGEWKSGKEGLEVVVGVGGGSARLVIDIHAGFRGLMPLICTLGTWWSGGLSPEDLDPFDFKGCREERSYYPSAAQVMRLSICDVAVEGSDCGNYATWEYSPEFNSAPALPQAHADFSSFKIQASFKMEAPRCFQYIFSFYQRQPDVCFCGRLSRARCVCLWPPLKTLLRGLLHRKKRIKL